MSTNFSGNMKSVSSSSSGSEKVGGSGVASSVGYDLEDSKPKSTSRMSCASDDSCAINELLEGRMDLNVNLPNSGESVVFNVERRTPMLDLLVNIATQYRFNAANYTINAGDHEFKASTPIGSLDVNQISIIPKPTKTVKSGPPVVPFQTTFRLQVNLPRNQLMVLRVTPNASIAAIKQIICSEKSLDSTKYQLVRFAGNSEAPQILEQNKSLAFYTINEVTLVSNKTLAQIEMQFGAPTTSQMDLSASKTTSTSFSPNKKVIQSLIVSQSNPDFTTIDDKTVLSHVPSVKSIKKRPAPPPPMSKSATLPNNIVSLQINGNKNENNITKNDESMIKTAVSESILETKSVPKNGVNHVRQNSGSDSSGYHESVLSSDSPESSSAVATLPKSNSTAASVSTSNMNIRQPINNKTGTKKRRAPPPPSSQSMNAVHENDHNNGHENNGHENNGHDNNGHDSNIDENKLANECMSDVSLPLSISSSSTSESSGTASSINNRSLSPIVITQTNGSSTPRRTSMNSEEVTLELPSTSTSSQLDYRQEERVSPQTNFIDVNSSLSETAQSTVSSDVSVVEEVTHSEANIVNAAQVIINEERSQNRLQKSDESTRSEPIMCQQNNLDIKDNDIVKKTLLENETTITINKKNDRNDSDVNETNTSITAESLPKEVEVSFVAPALAVSHDSDLSGHDCVEQVEERDKSNIINNEKPGSIVMPIISPPLQFVDDYKNQNYYKSNKAMVMGTANNCLHVNQCADGSGSYPSNYNSSVRSCLDSMRRAYLHEMKGDGNLKLTGVKPHNSIENSDNHKNECEIQNVNDFELAEMSLPLPPPSPFRNSNHEEHNSSVHECEDEMGQGVDERIDDKPIANDLIEENLNRSLTIDHKIEDTIDYKIENTIQASINNICSDSQKRQNESETKTLIVSEEDKLNNEIEVTLQSLNDELDRLELKDQTESELNLNNEQSFKDSIEANIVINATKDNEIIKNTQEFNLNNEGKVSVQVKQINNNVSEFETIKNNFERRQTPSPTPRTLLSVNGKSKVIMNREEIQPQVSTLSNGKTTLIVNKSETPTPPPLSLSPQPPSISPTPSNEDKFTAEEVRQLCRPRVKLTNFSIGSYKKDVDIFEETKRTSKSQPPATAPVMIRSGRPTLATIKPFVVTASVKQEKIVTPVNQNKSKVNITATSTTATTTSTIKPSTPVIQTLITTAPKINRIQSWSGQKSVTLDQRNIKQPVKTNERYVSQIAINRDTKSVSPPPVNDLDEELKSPHLVVQTLIAKTESQIKNRSPSPQDLPQKTQLMKEHTTISIKPGLESVIQSNLKQHMSTLKKTNEVNSVPTVPQNHSQQSITIGKTKVQLKTTKPSIEMSNEPSVEASTQPFIPPPIPPPLPQNISSLPIDNRNPSKTNVNTKIFHTKGWNSNKATQNGNVPKVKHVEPPNSGVDVRDALLNEIKSFGGKNSLKRVSKNRSWQLEVHGNSVKT